MKFRVLLCLLVVILQSCQDETPRQKYLTRLDVDFIRSVCANDPSISLLSIGASYVEGVDEMHLGFRVRRQMNIDEARNFYVKHAEHYIETINNDVALRPFLRSYPVTIDNIDLSFQFLNQNNELVSPPYIVHVSNLKGTVYYAIDNKQRTRFETLFKEPYEEAVRIVRGE